MSNEIPQGNKEAGFASASGTMTMGFVFWYKDKNGYPKSVCATPYKKGQRWWKYRWFLLKVFFYKLFHKTL